VAGDGSHHSRARGKKTACHQTGATIGYTGTGMLIGVQHRQRACSIAPRTRKCRRLQVKREKAGFSQCITAVAGFHHRDTRAPARRRRGVSRQ